MPYNYLGSTINPDSLNHNDLLYAYSNGYFPLGEVDGTIGWYEHIPRGIIEISDKKSDFKISRSLQQVINKKQFEIKIDNDFYSVIKLCSEVHRPTWITREIIHLYLELHQKGFAHSIEAYLDNQLAGGLYGVAFRSAFFGESMFHLKNNASKVCVVKLYEILRNNNYQLFDIQMITPIFKSFGAINISKSDYRKRLHKALAINSKFDVSLPMLRNER